jgi:predicted RNA-binding Zn ribbon-like protein
MAVAHTIDELELTGGDPALDFVNTVETRASDPLELLRSYRDFLDWTARVGLVEARTARSLRHFAADDVLARAIALREAAYEVLVAVAVEHAPPPKTALAVINAEVADAGRGAGLAFDGETFTFQPPPRDAVLPLHLVARALADLLTSPRLRRVGRCEGVGNCGWLFLDTTKNHSRRWCSMAGCGSRAKMRRYYARGKAKSSSPNSARS